MPTIQDRFVMRRGLAADLASVNEVPLQGEWILTLDAADDAHRLKIGDGTTHYNDLPYIATGTAGMPIIEGPGIQIETDSDGVKTIASKLVAGDQITIAEDSFGALKINASIGDLGTLASSPDTTGTVTPPTKITNWIKVTLGTNAYLLPAFRYLGEGVVSSLPAYIASLGPVAYWQLQESSGTTLHDDVAGETLTLSGSYALGSASLVTGDARKSILFSGGYATGSAGAKWALGGGDFAGTVVARWTSAVLSTFFSIRDSTPTNILAILSCNRVAAGDVNAENWDFNTHKANSPGTGYNTNTVHALGFNFDNTTKTLSLYIDGAMVKSVVCGGTRPTATTMLVHLASNFGSQNFSGNVQDLALYGRQLTATEHLNIANIVLNGHT